jgi:hypothetical protein
MQEVVKLEEPRISPDGQRAKFIARTSTGEEFEMIFPVSELREIGEALILLSESAQVSQAAAQAHKETYGKRDSEGWMDQPSSVCGARISNRRQAWHRITRDPCARCAQPGD